LHSDGVFGRDSLSQLRDMGRCAVPSTPRSRPLRSVPMVTGRDSGPQVSVPTRDPRSERLIRPADESIDPTAGRCKGGTGKRSPPTDPRARIGEGNPFPYHSGSLNILRIATGATSTRPTWRQSAQRSSPQGLARPRGLLRDRHYSPLLGPPRPCPDRRCACSTIEPRTSGAPYFWP